MMAKLTKAQLDEYKRRMMKCKSMDRETGHMAADDVLADMLIALGYKEIVDLFVSLNKWYA